MNIVIRKVDLKNRQNFCANNRPPRTYSISVTKYYCIGDMNWFDKKTLENIESNIWNEELMRWLNREHTLKINNLVPLRENELK